MKKIIAPSTQEIREAWSGVLTKTGEYTYELADPEQADAEFNLWLKTERNRVAKLGMKKERKLIIQALEEYSHEIASMQMRLGILEAIRHIKALDENS